MIKEKIYLREKSSLGVHQMNTSLDIFSGDIKKDKKYLKETQQIDARYFEIKEVKEKKNERGKHKQKKR